MAALAAVLFQVAFNMCGYRSFIKMFKAPKSDVIVMLVAFFLTVIIDLTVAIEVGVLLAAVLFIKRMSDVSEMETVTEALKEDDEEAAHNDLSRQVPKGVVVYELAGSLFFGAVDKFKDTMARISDKPKILILRMRSVSSIDAAGIQMIEDLLNRCNREGTQLLLSGVHAQPVVTRPSTVPVNSSDSRLSIPRTKSSRPRRSPGKRTSTSRGCLKNRTPRLPKRRRKSSPKR